MAESQTVTILRAKREEIAAAILNYERQLENARADFAHITAALGDLRRGRQAGLTAPLLPTCAARLPVWRDCRPVPRQAG